MEANELKELEDACKQYKHCLDKANDYFLKIVNRYIDIRNKNSTNIYADRMNFITNIILDGDKFCVYGESSYDYEEMYIFLDKKYVYNPDLLEDLEKDLKFEYEEQKKIIKQQRIKALKDSIKKLEKE